MIITPCVCVCVCVIFIYRIFSVIAKWEVLIKVYMHNIFSLSLWISSF